MPFYQQNRIATRFFVYHNLVHNGEQFEPNKLYAILAPFKTGVRAPNHPPFSSTALNVSNGMPFLSTNTFGSGNKSFEETAGNWSFVPDANIYPIFETLYPSLSDRLPNINPSSRLGVSQPFTMVLMKMYYKNRYFLETLELSARRPNQPTPQGRWVYSRKNAFTSCQAYIKPTPYTFNYSLSNEFAIPNDGRMLKVDGHNCVISDIDANVILKRNVQTSYTSFSPNSSIRQDFVNSFFSTNPSVNISLSPFNELGQSLTKYLGTKFGQQVDITSRNVAVTDPLSGNGRIYIYGLQSVAGGPYLTNENVLTPTLNQPRVGEVISYKTIYNNKHKPYQEFLATTSRSPSNSAIQIFRNDYITQFNGVPLPDYNGRNFTNVWSSHTLTNSNLEVNNGYFGYSLDIQTTDSKYNANSNFMYVSQPYNGGGKVYVYYFVENSANLTNTTWHLVTAISNPQASNYGESLSVGGARVVVSGPRSVVSSNPGCVIDFYKMSTVKGDYQYDGNGYATLSSLSGFKLLDTLQVNSSVTTNLFYKLEKTDSMFIPSSTNLGKHVCYQANYQNKEKENKAYYNFYGDHLVVTGDTKSQVYSRYFDGFELNTDNLPGSICSSIDNNKIYQIASNGTLFLHTVGLSAW